MNLRGHLLCTRAAIPEILKRQGGAIVYTSSGAAFMGEPERPSYAMTKSGLNALVRHVASKWGRKHIRANAVAPGLVLTEGPRSVLSEEFMKLALRGTRSCAWASPRTSPPWSPSSSPPTGNGSTARSSPSTGAPRFADNGADGARDSAGVDPPHGLDHLTTRSSG